MGKNIKIIATLLPNGRNKAGEYQFSLFLSPRLPDSGRLSDYYEILNWPSFSQFFTANSNVNVLVNHLNETTGTYPAGSQQYDLEFTGSKIYDPDHKSAGAELWDHLFRYDTPVQSWILDEGSYKARTVFLNTVTGEGHPSYIPSDNEPVRGQASLFAEAQSDIAANVMQEQEVLARNKVNQEFHRKMSILAGYPHLLRETGWIIDFKINGAPNQPFNMIKLTGFNEQLPPALRDRKWQLFSDAVNILTPWTAVEETSFTCRYAQKYQNDYFDVRNGYITAVKSAYQLVAEQYNRSETLKQFDEEIKKDTAPVQAVNTRTYTKMEDYLKDSKQDSEKGSEGIQLKVCFKDCHPVRVATEHQPGSDMFTMLQADQDAIMINGRDNQSANIDDYILFGHHLDAGYRVDVCELVNDDLKANDQFLSLCDRRADYAIDLSENPAKKKFKILFKNLLDHPAIPEVAVAGKSGKIYFDENICRWNNWSLVCQQPGQHPVDPSTEPSLLEYNDLELLNIRPEEKSLLGLRFGKRYKFLVKTVDICGNFTALPALDSAVFHTPNPYRRLERFTPPELFFTPKQGIERNGDATDIIIIRSPGEPGSSRAEDVSYRAMSPARSTVSFTELHGEFDAAFKSGSETLLMKIYDKAAYHRSEHDHEEFSVDDTIPFLTDPGHAAITVTYQSISWVAGAGGPQVLTGTVRLGETYLERKFTEIKLHSHTDNSASLSVNGRSVYLALPAGTVGQLTLSPASPQPCIIKGGIPDALAKSVTVVHAIKRPCVTGQDVLPVTLELLDRSPYANEQSNIEVRFNKDKFSNSASALTENFPFSSSDQIWLVCRYCRIVVNRNLEEGFDSIEFVDYVRFGNTADLEPGQILPDLIIQDDLIKSFIDHEPFKSLAHSLGDTKFYSVEYALQGQSRFKGFFPEAKDDEFITKKSLGKHIVKNSSKMKAPEIHSIVPLVLWVQGNPKSRVNNMFRVYFKNDWYESGDQEQAAVIFLDNDQLTPAESGTVFEALEDLVSFHGADPASTRSVPSADQQVRIGLTRSSFSNTVRPLIEDINCLLLNNQANSGDTKMEDPYKSKLKAAVFAVCFDPRKQLFFTDISLTDSPDLYMPFYKFAICKYQDHSIQEPGLYDYRFSRVSMTPAVQQLPKRTVKMTGNGSFKIDGPARPGGKPNEFYAYVSDSNQISEYVSNITDDNSPVRLQLNNGEWTWTPPLINWKTVTLEEFEVYEALDADGTPVNIESPIDPRNDLRRRLVGSYIFKRN